MNDQELRTQLWDYCYGLLEPAEAAALEVRIKSDPRVARLFAETRLESDLLAGAARVEQPPIPLTTRMSPAAAPTQRMRAVRSERRAVWANWVAGLAAVLLVGLFAYGWRPATPVAAVPPALPLDLDGVRPGEDFQTYAELRGPAQAQEGQAVQFDIQTFDGKNAPKQAELNLQVVDASGNAEFQSTVTTDEKGRGEVSVPGAAVRRGRTLLLKDRAKDAAPLVAAPLDVAADEFKAHLEVDRELMQPGETVFFRALVLGENSHVETTPTDAEFFLVDPTGETVPGSAAKDVTAHGVAAGEAIIPSNAAEGEYAIVVRSPHDTFAETRIPLQVQRGEAPQLALRSNADRGMELKSMAGRSLVQAKQQNSLESAAADGAVSRPPRTEAQSSPGKPMAAATPAPNADTPAPAPPAAPAAMARKAESRATGGAAAEKQAESGKKKASGGDESFAFGGGVGRGGSAGGGSGGGTINAPIGGPAGLQAGGFAEADVRRGEELEAAKEVHSANTEENAKRLKIELTREVERFAKRDALARNGAVEQAASDKSLERSGGKSTDPDGLADAKGDGNEGKAEEKLKRSFLDEPMEFAVGQEVSFRLATTTEGGDHVAAVLGVRVVKEEFATTSDLKGLADFAASSAGAEASNQRFAVADELLHRRSQSANAAAAGGPTTAAPAGKEASSAGDKAEREELAEMDAAPEPIVTLGSNRAPIEDEIVKTKQDVHSPALGLPASRSAFDVRPLGKRLLVGGLLGLVAIGSLLVLRVPVRSWAWGPALVAAGACVTLGIVRLAPQAGSMVAESPSTTSESWAARRALEPEVLQKSLGDSVNGTMPAAEDAPASAPQDTRTFDNLSSVRKDEQETRDEAQLGQDADGKQAKAMSDAKFTDADAKGGRPATQKRNEDRQIARDKSPAVPPATLLWNPRLITDETGEARIQFRLPEQPGRYRVQIQGHSNGRLGAAELVIQTSAPVEAGTTLAEPAASSKPVEAKPAQPQPAEPAPQDVPPEPQS